MGLKELFTDPSTRPKALAASLLLGGALAFGAYQFWIRRDSISQGVSKAAHKVEDAASKVIHKTEDFIEAHSPSYSSKLKPAKERVHDFKNLNLKRFVEIKEACKKHEKDANLDLTTLKNVQLLAIEMSEKDFRKIIKQNREHRRKHIEHDKPKYEEIVIRAEEDFEEVFNQNIKEILADMGVSQDQYDKSIEAHVQHDQEVYLVGTTLYDIMVGRLPAFVDHLNPTKEKVIEICTFMIEQYQKTFYKPLHKTYFTDVKEKMVLDKIYEKYELEEEGLRKLRTTYDSIEVFELQEKYSNLITKDEDEFGNFPHQDKK